MRGMLVYKNSLSPFLWFSRQWNLHLQYERFGVTSHIVISLNSQFMQESLYTLIPRQIFMKWQSSEMMTIWRQFRTVYTQHARRILQSHFLGRFLWRSCCQDTWETHRWGHQSIYSRISCPLYLGRFSVKRLLSEIMIVTGVIFCDVFASFWQLRRQNTHKKIARQVTCTIQNLTCSVICEENNHMWIDMLTIETTRAV